MERSRGAPCQVLPGGDALSRPSRKVTLEASIFCLLSFSQFPPCAALAPPTTKTTPTTLRPRPSRARAPPSCPIGWRSGSTERPRRPEERTRRRHRERPGAHARGRGAASKRRVGGREGGAARSREGVRPAGRDGEEPGGRSASERLRAAWLRDGACGEMAVLGAED